MKAYLHKKLHPISTPNIVYGFLESSKSKIKIEFSELFDFTEKTFEKNT
jgi:hypothetical protein